MTGSFRQQEINRKYIYRPGLQFCRQDWRQEAFPDDNGYIPDDSSFLSVFKVCKSDYPVLRYAQKRICRSTECKISRLLVWLLGVVGDLPSTSCGARGCRRGRSTPPTGPNRSTFPTLWANMSVFKEWKMDQRLRNYDHFTILVYFGPHFGKIDPLTQNPGSAPGIEQPFSYGKLYIC